MRDKMVTNHVEAAAYYPPTRLSWMFRTHSEALAAPCDFNIFSNHTPQNAERTQHAATAASPMKLRPLASPSLGPVLDVTLEPSWTVARPATSPPSEAHCVRLKVRSSSSIENSAITKSLNWYLKPQIGHRIGLQAIHQHPISLGTR